MQLFLDPTGRHIIVTADNGDNYYLFHTWRRTKELAKLKVLYAQTACRQTLTTDPT